MHRILEARQSAVFPGSDKPCGLVGEGLRHTDQHWLNEEGKIVQLDPKQTDARVDIRAW